LKNVTNEIGIICYAISQIRNTKKKKLYFLSKLFHLN